MNLHASVKRQTTEAATNQRSDFYKNIFYTTARIAQLIGCCFRCLTLACECIFNARIVSISKNVLSNDYHVNFVFYFFNFIPSFLFPFYLIFYCLVNLEV